MIDGFFIGYRSFDSSALLVETSNTDGSDSTRASNILQGTGSGAQVGTTKQLVERPTFTYKTIRLINQHQQQQPQPTSDDNGSVLQSTASSSSEQSQDTGGATPVLSPISSITKTVPANSMLMGNTNNKFASLANSNKPEASGGANSGSSEVALVVISNFEYVITGLERNTEYTILIQCFNKKGTGPSSDPVVTKTLMHDPPGKLTLLANELTETSLRLNWHFLAETNGATNRNAQLGDYPQSSPGLLSGRLGSPDLVDGFVLTFAKIAQPVHSRGQQWSKKQQEVGSSSSATLANQQQQQQTHQRADSAARISKQFPPSNDHNFQYNPPIQPSQLLDHQWQAIQLAPQQREHTLKNLECGTWYAMKIWAFNKVGKGEPSDLVTATTRGKAPVPASRNQFLSVNSTQVKLNLNAWYDGGCDIEKFIVQYRARGQREWILVSNNILREQGGVIIRDLAPAGSYELLVGAQNHVGLSEAKYRFVTLDSEGKPVVVSKSFLPILNGDNNDLDDGDSDADNGDNSMVDYSDDQSTNGANIRRESYAGGDHLTSGAVSGSGRWLLLARHILNSPLTLLLTFCVFLVLLGLLLFHRFSGNLNSRNDNHNNYHSNGHSTTGGLSSSKTAAHDCGAGAPMMIRRCSLDGMATMLDGDPPMSCVTNGSSSTSTDSPGRMINVHAPSTMGRLNGSHQMGPFYGPSLDCNYNNVDNNLTANYCNANQPGGNGVGGGIYGTNSSIGFHHGEPPPTSSQHQQQSLNHNWGASVDQNYPAGANQSGHQNQQQHVGFYSALPPTSSSYATTVHRSATMDNPSSANLEHDLTGQDGRQQYLMQMLLISPQQQQQSNLSNGQTGGQRHEDYPTSMTTAALATMARQKAGFVKSPPNGTGDFGGGGGLCQSGPGNFTLGRMPTQNQHDSFHPGEQQSSQP